MRSTIDTRDIGAAVLACVLMGAAATSPALQARQAPAVAAPSPAGPWTGAIVMPNSRLGIDITLATNASKEWSGTIDITVQGLRGAKLTNVVVDGRRISFAMVGIPGDPTFMGTLSDDGQGISGTFTQGGATLPFELKRGVRVLARPQEPKAPFPYRSEEVSFRNAKADVRLAGTLTLPQGAGRFPAVLLISGSGPQDRDCTIAGHKPFLLWADTLTRRGVAVLRVDDRGVGASERGTMNPTTADLAEDVRAGLAFLASRADIDAAKVGLIGHSEGANIAAMVAADTPAARFIVMLAGTGVRGDELLLQQVAAISTAQGAPKPIVDWDLAMRRRVYDQILAEKDGKPDVAARRALVESVPPLPGVPDATVARQQADLLLSASSAPWVRYFLAYDPQASVSRVKVPVLTVNGERDLQIPARENVSALRTAIEAAGNANATIQVVPNLNHLLQTARTGLPEEYESIEETIAPGVLTLVTDWVLARVK